MSGTLGLTGASGYIGKAVIRTAVASGWHVVAIGRHPVEGAQDWRPADLKSSPPRGLLDGIGAVLHLASNTGGGDVPPSSEVVFARDLAEQAAQRGVPLVFVSSQASAVDAPSDYGRTKFAIEEMIRPLGAVVVRPGIVIGGDEAGLFGLLVGLVRRLPVIPDLVPRPFVQPVHVDDLTGILLTACKSNKYAGRTLTVGGAPVSFTELLLGIARYRLRVCRVKFPVPIVFLRAALQVSSSLNAKSNWSPARLDSLVRLPLLTENPGFDALGVKLRPFRSALDRRGAGVRFLLQEGYSLARAMTGADPPAAMLRRYVYLMRTLGQNDALPLPLSLLQRPAWLAALDQPSTRLGDLEKGGLSWRMNVMSRLAEAQPELASLYLMTSSRCGKFSSIMDIIDACAREIHSRAVRRMARHLIKGRL